jgi:hypothetical protein
LGATSQHAVAMSDDPLRSAPPHRFGDELTYGRVLHQALTGTAHYHEALTIIDTLRHEDLEHLALYVAAEAAGARSPEVEGGPAWAEWWAGIAPLDPEGQPEGTPTPGMLWRVVRPAEADDPDRAA